MTGTLTVTARRNISPAHLKVSSFCWPHSVSPTPRSIAGRTRRLLQDVGVGLLVSVVATLINLFAARELLKAGREFNSITLEADAKHLMTDVWISIGVIIGIGLVWVSGWLWLDPLIALLVALNIVWTGWQLLHRSASGLMDEALPEEQLEAIKSVLANYRRQGLDFHALAHPSGG